MNVAEIQQRVEDKKAIKSENKNYNIVKLAPWIYKRANFQFKEHPIYHPDTNAYMDYWEIHEKRSVEGFWGLDQDSDTYNPDLPGGYRFMVPQHYWYSNFCFIQHQIENTLVPDAMLPDVRDIDWYRFYYFTKCEGFSGFTNDPEYTSHYLVERWERHVSNNIRFELNPKEQKLWTYIQPEITKADGTYKKYVEAIEYLKKTFPRPLGTMIFNNPMKNWFELASRGVGKEQPHSEVIITPTGFTTMGEIKIGDQVIGSDGKPTTVLNKFPQGVKDVYEITLSDGRKVTAGLDHLWKVWDRSKNRSDRRTVYSTKSTKDLLENYVKRKVNQQYKKRTGKTKYVKEYKYGLPLCEPVEYSHKNLPIDPYFLGLWLGSSSTDTLSITTEYEEIGAYCYKIAKNNNLPYTFTSNSDDNSLITYAVEDLRNPYLKNPLKDSFRSLNLFNNKHIPVEYLNASAEQRLELLKGLLDIDGIVYSKIIQLYLSNQLLAEQITLLARSLGIYTQIKHVATKYFKVILTTNLGVFNLTVKYNQHFRSVIGKKYNKTKYERAYITKISKLPYQEESSCILVDNSDHTYLTRDYIVTHNSYVYMGIISQKFNFFGARTYDEYLKINKGPVICVGSALSAKSGELLSKFKFSQDQLVEKFGAYEDEDLNLFIPGFFHKEVMGTLSSGNEKNAYRHQYKQKRGNVWTDKGTRTKIVHNSYDSNPEAFVGQRSILMVEDEVGLNAILLDSQKADETVMIMDTKIGVAIKGGCVCAGTKVWTKEGKVVNIEDLTQEDGILGFDGSGVIKQPISWFKPPEEKECYRITTTGDNFIECSYDHPLMWSHRMWNKSIKGKNHKKLTFKQASDIKPGDQLAIYDFENSIPHPEPIMWINNEKGKGKYYEGKTDIDNLRFSYVTKVEHIGKKRIYNLTADGTNAYISNGFISANTGGNMEKIVQCKVVFYDPKSYGYVGVPNYWENPGQEIGCFIPAYYQDSSFRDPNGNQNVEDAYEQEMYERSIKAESNNTSALDGLIIARPLIPSEMFLSPETNIFPTSLIREHRANLEARKVFDIIASVGKLVYENSDQQSVKWVNEKDKYRPPILNYDIKAYDHHISGTIVIYEHPSDNIPNPGYKNALYKIGYDPVNDDHGGTSLAAIIVYKGYTSGDWNRGRQNNIVATYYGREDKVDDIHDIAIKLALYYNAKILPETNIPDFIRYCKRIHKYHLLQPTPFDSISKFLKSPGNKYEVGLHINKTLNLQGEQLIRQWLMEERGIDPETNKVILNLHHIDDLRILDELASYTREGNTDGISALQLIMFWIHQEQLVPVKERTAQKERSKIMDYFRDLNKRKENSTKGAFHNW